MGNEPSTLTTLPELEGAKAAALEALEDLDAARAVMATAGPLTAAAAAAQKVVEDNTAKVTIATMNLLAATRIATNATAVKAKKHLTTMKIVVFGVNTDDATKLLDAATNAAEAAAAAAATAAAAEQEYVELYLTVRQLKKEIQASEKTTSENV